MERKIRVVMAKLGLDIHWRGVYLVSQFLKDAGMEVIYLGNKFPEQIVEAAIEEDADVVGLSTLGGNHLALGPKVVNLLKKKGMDKIKVFMGGVIPPKHIPLLKKKGIHEIYGPDTPMEVIIKGISDSVSVH
ncbi:MAG: cobalamin-dependent protein [Pseudomonadota bacterium]|nr:cobalamin-dependent protein [Pseudomonadota bacterium]